ncbi:hypothetical protein ABPG77_007479, partial [Micractinium sp. CCAP 211/92]
AWAPCEPVFTSLTHKSTQEQGNATFLVETRPAESGGGGPKTYFQQRRGLARAKVRSGAGLPMPPLVTQEARRLLGSGYPEQLVLHAADSIRWLHSYTSAAQAAGAKAAAERLGAIRNAAKHGTENAKIGTCQACIFLYRSEEGEDAAALQDAVAASQPGSFGCNGSCAGHVLSAGLEKFRVQKLRRHIKSGKPCSEAVLLDIVSCERDNRGGARAGAGKRPAAAKAATKAASNKRKDDKQKLRREEEKQKKARKN